MLENKPKTRTLIIKVAPIITALGVIISALYYVFAFYADAVVSHDLAKNHANEMRGLEENISILNNSLTTSSEKINQLTDQMTLLAAALQYEKDSKEFVILRDRRSQLSTQEVIRYCELYRALKMGVQCDI